MEPATITVISLVIFGVASLFAAFIRQLILSRDKKLNEISQLRALHLETIELKKIRLEMANYKRLDGHYSMLGNNRETIRYIDNHINDIFNRKMILIKKYSEHALEESSALISGEKSGDKLARYNHLREEMAKQISFYDKEIEMYQARRAHLWDADEKYQKFLLEEERSRNQRLDDFYQRHANLLTKIYLRHNDNAASLTKYNLHAGTKTFKSAFMAPINFITGLFEKLPNISLEKSQKEKDSREDVSKMEDDINEENNDEKNQDKNEQEQEKNDIENNDSLDDFENENLLYKKI